MCLSVVTPPAISPGEANFTTAGVAPDVPHHETACTRRNLGVEDVFDDTHIKVASKTKPSTCVDDLTYTDGDPFRTWEQKNGVIKIRNGMPRYPLHGSAPPGIAITGITGAEITEMFFA